MHTVEIDCVKERIKPNQREQKTEHDAVEEIDIMITKQAAPIDESPRSIEAHIHLSRSEVSANRKFKNLLLCCFISEKTSLGYCIGKIGKFCLNILKPTGGRMIFICAMFYAGVSDIRERNGNKQQQGTTQRKSILRL